MWKDFDTRFAAARSLQYFFRGGGIEHILGEDCLLEALLALHTTLTDDDEEIREIGATTVSSLTRNLSTPLQAVQDLAAWMVGKYKSSVSFAHMVIDQMTGPDAWTRIASSLDPNDSLFAEEDSNLFTDEVREARMWAETFHGLSKEAVENSNAKSPLNTLSSWVLDGLNALHLLLKEEDGPVGKFSKPGTYYPCLQVLICTNAFIKYLNTHYLSANSSLAQISGRTVNSNVDAILLLLKEFISKAEKKEVHEDLIFEVLSPESLEKTRLGVLCPEIASFMPDRLTFALRQARPPPPPEDNNNTDK